MWDTLKTNLKLNWFFMSYYDLIVMLDRYLNIKKMLITS